MRVSKLAAQIIEEIYALLTAPLANGNRYVKPNDPENDPMDLDIEEQFAGWFQAWEQKYCDLCTLPPAAIDESERIRGLRRCLRELRRHRVVQNIKDFLKI